MTALKQPLTPAIDAPLLETHKRAGRLCYYADGDGEPLLLLHSINAAASAYEVRPLFDALRKDYRVYAPDLPGFGFSERSRRNYSIGLYIDAIADMLDLVEDENPGAGIHALALSLSSEFLARSALSNHHRLKSLALVSPTGFNRGADKLRAAEGSTRGSAIAGAIASIGGRGLFALLTRPRVIRYFLRRTFGSSNIDEGLARYDILSAAQPGAHHAPLAFVSGRLFSRDLRNVYEQIELPAWIAHGSRGDFQDYSQTGWAVEKANWSVNAYDSGALPHFEHPAEFLTDYRRFLATTE